MVWYYSFASRHHSCKQLSAVFRGTYDDHRLGAVQASGYQSEPVATERRDGVDLSNFLVKTAKITSDARDRAEQIARESRERFEVVLTKLGLITERELTDVLAALLELPIATASDYPKTPILTETLSTKFLREAHFLPLAERSDGVAIALTQPLNQYIQEAIRFAVGRPLILYLAYPAELEAVFDRLYGNDELYREKIDDAIIEQKDGLSDDLDRLRDSASDAPVIKLVNQLISQAVELGASDIHIEPMENELQVRYRLDGVLQKVDAPPQQLAASIVSRVKVMTKLNIAERRLPQDGRISLAVRGKDIDFRVSTVPTGFGESVVLRVLDRENIPLNFDALGFDPSITSAIRTLLQNPHGIILVTGPTGSGKTTTLYAALLELNTLDRKILTVEDPIEYRLGGINQVQVKPQIGLSFANALRSFLRQDPDIMMVGEIRDLETAQIAVQAALTGHLILSTLHTNDAASAVTRLLDMGIEDYLLTSTLTGVLAQRLVRRLCRHCRQIYEPLPELRNKLHLDRLADGNEPHLFKPKGCSECGGTGYRGRTAVVEVLNIDDEIRRAVLNSADAAELFLLTQKAGMQSMHTHGLKKALSGETSIEEVMRITGHS